MIDLLALVQDYNLSAFCHLSALLSLSVASRNFYHATKDTIDNRLAWDVKVGLEKYN